MSEKPNLDKFKANAAAYKAAEWGDGSILEAIKQIIEMLLPFIMQCFAMSEKTNFIETSQNPSPLQEARLRRQARLHARRLGNLSIRDRLEVADGAVEGMASTAAVMTDAELGECYDELHE